jgi:lactoylglutathione lyase
LANQKSGRFNIVKFVWNTLMVKDLERSVKFYEEVIGLKVNSRFMAGQGLEIAFLGDGDVQIELVWNADNPGFICGDAVSWGFKVESMEEALKMIMEKGIPVHSGPFIHPNVKYFFIQDPDGLKIQVKEVLE